MTPLVFWLDGCCPEPEWLPAALDHLRRERKLGLVLRLPREPDRRCAIGHELEAIADEATLDGREILLEALFLCMEDDVVRACLRGAPEGFDVLLIDARGTVIDGHAMDSPDDLLETARCLLDGESGERLAERVDAARRLCPPEALAAYKRRTEGPDTERAIAHAASILPLLIHGRHQREDLHLAWWSDRVLCAYLRALPASSWDGSSPHGARFQPYDPRATRCCEERWSQALTCQSCGMSLADARSRSFVRFLSR